MRRLRDADSTHLALAIVGLFVLANAVALVGMIPEPCDGLTRPIAWVLASAPLFGLTMFLILARVTPRTSIAIVVSIATIVLTALTFVPIVLLSEAELCAS